MKLIDVLVMISKGELKEGTKVVWKETEYTYNGNDLMDEEDDYSLLDFVTAESLNEEVELIDHSPDVGKMEKIEELDIDLTTWNDLYIEQKADVLFDKLNEVIRELNRRAE